MSVDQAKCALSKCLCRIRRIFNNTATITWVRRDGNNSIWKNETKLNERTKTEIIQEFQKLPVKDCSPKSEIQASKKKIVISLIIRIWDTESTQEAKKSPWIAYRMKKKNSTQYKTCSNNNSNTMNTNSDTPQFIIIVRTRQTGIKSNQTMYATKSHPHKNLTDICSNDGWWTSTHSNCQPNKMCSHNSAFAGKRTEAAFSASNLYECALTKKAWENNNNSKSFKFRLLLIRAWIVNMIQWSKSGFN